MKEATEPVKVRYQIRVCKNIRQVDYFCGYCETKIHLTVLKYEFRHCPACGVEINWSGVPKGASL